MSLWAQKRQATYALIVILFIAAVAAIPTYYIFFNKPQTCSDGILNQNEEGIDCGGVCTTVCKQDSQDIIVHWQQFFKVTDGVYSVVANVENPNLKVYAENITYHFRLIDADGVVVAERDGSTFVLPGSIFPIFESGLQTGKRIPIRVTFEITSTPNWQKKPYQLASMVVIDQTLSSASSTPRVDATLQNQADYKVSNVEVVAVVYDTKNNAMAASHTVVDSIAPRSMTHLFFTWPHGFDRPISKILLTPKLRPRFNI